MPKLRISFALLSAFCFLWALSSATTAQAEEKMNIGFVYISPIGDAGWSKSHDIARQELEKTGKVTTTYIESVPEGADSERVIRQMARKGAKIIFTTSFGYMEPTLAVAEEFPNIVFMHCSGYKTAANVSNYFGRIYEARYLTGLVAGSMTKSNTIGYVAAYPIPEVIRGINAFTLGVRAANPKAEVRVVWTKTWYGPALEKEAAQSLLDVGADVIAQHQDSPGPQEAAQERGAWSIGYNTDMSSFAPKSHLVAAIWNWTPFYLDVVEKVQNGTWKSGSYWPGVKEGIVDISPFGPMVSEEAKALALKHRQDIIDGSLVVFTGPIKNQAGEVKVPAGTTLTDAELLALDWFVEGVVGTTK